MKEPSLKETDIGMIPEDWAIVHLGDVCSKIGSGITPRGAEKVYKDSGVALIRSQNVYNNSFSEDGLVYIDEATAKEMENVALKKNDVLLNITGDSVARCCTVPESILPARVNQHVSIIRANEQELNPIFLRYYLTTPRMQEFMLSLAQSGGTRNALTKGMIEEFAVPKPRREEQEIISKILSDLDSRIKLNQQMNKTLEATAKAIFRHWFIDFEFPNEEGKPYKSSGGEMVYCEQLGQEIPNGWTVKGLPEVADVIDCLHTHKPDSTPSDRILLQVYNIGKHYSIDLSDKYTISNQDYKEWTRNIEASEGDILFTNAGLVGAIARVPNSLKAAIGRNITVARPTKISPIYLLRYLVSSYGRREIEKNTDAGTIFNSLNVKGIREIVVLVPPETLLLKFEGLAVALRTRVENGLAQNSSLSYIRDSLLPKLMSGKVRVPVEAR